MSLNINDLFAGLVGTVVYEDHDSSDANQFGIEDGCVIVHGKELYVTEEVSAIEDFECDPDKVILFESDAYHGVGCYEGIVEVDGNWFYLDIINEGMVFALVP